MYCRLLVVLTGRMSMSLSRSSFLCEKMKIFEGGLFSEVSMRACIVVDDARY